MEPSETVVEKQTAALFIYKGWSVEEIAADFGLEADRVEHWRRNFSWDERQMEYLNSQERLKNYLGALKIKLAREAFKTLESKKISDMAALLRAEASLAKANGSVAKEKPLSRREISRLMREEYGIDQDDEEDTSSISKEVA